MGTTNAACAVSQPSASPLSTVGKPAARNTPANRRTRGDPGWSGSDSIVFCCRMSTYRTTAPSRTPPAAGKPNSAREPNADRRPAVWPAAFPEEQHVGAVRSDRGQSGEGAGKLITPHRDQHKVGGVVQRVEHLDGGDRALPADCVLQDHAVAPQVDCAATTRKHGDLMSGGSQPTGVHASDHP